MANNLQGVNYKKTQHDTFNYGTPRIYPVVVTRNDEGDFSNHQLNDSDFHKVMTALQARCEIYGVGEVSGTQFTLLVNLNTLVQDDNDYGDVPNITDTISILQTEVLNATGISVNIENGKIVGANLAYDC